MAILLKNAQYLNWKSLEITETNILVYEGIDEKIEFIDRISPEIEKTAKTVLDCRGMIATKSFAVGHHHAYSALSRGMPAPAKNPQSFREILQYIWWNLDKALNRDMVEASALATAIACAKSGASFIIDHHASPNFIDGSLEIMAAAFEKIGLSHLLCYEISDRDGEKIAQNGLDETNAYLKNYQGLVGLHASFTLGDKTMKKASQLMENHNSGVHIHVAEGVYDQQQCEEHYGMRVVERLKHFGMLESPKSILAHCLHLSSYERRLLHDSKAWIVENMESNLNNNVGFFNAEGLGDRIMLGTDGMHSDMLRSAQMAFFAGQYKDTIDFGSAWKRFRNTHNYIETNNFKGDGENNLVLLKYDSPTAINASNFLGHFIFGLNSSHVQHLISNGQLIMKNRTLLNIDEEEILEFTKIQSQRLWETLKK